MPGKTSATSPSTTRTFSAITETFFFNQTKASGLFSTAITRVVGASVAIASDSAPEPAPRSITLTGAGRFSICCNTASTNNSDSGRGTKTPGPTSMFKYLNPATPVRYCNGSKLSRRSNKS